MNTPPSYDQRLLSPTDAGWLDSEFIICRLGVLEGAQGLLVNCMVVSLILVLPDYSTTAVEGTQVVVASGIVPGPKPWGTGSRDTTVIVIRDNHIQ